MKFLHPEEVDQVMNEVGHQIFTVTFLKENGEIRVLNGRRGVKKHLQGGKSTIAKCPHLYSVRDLKNDGYRCFNKNRVLSLRSFGKELAA